MATDHTDGEPPSRGSTILVNIGSIRNSRAALRKMAATNVASSAPWDCATRLMVAAMDGSVMVRFLAFDFLARHLGGERPFARPPLEIPEMRVQLLERKAEREKMLQRIARQDPHETFTTNGCDLGGVVFECRI